MINIDYYFMTTAALSSCQGQDSIVHCKDAFLQAAVCTNSQKCKLTGTGGESLSIKWEWKQTDFPSYLP